jgi:hypothetical protein
MLYSGAVISDHITPMVEHRRMVAKSNEDKMGVYPGYLYRELPLRSFLPDALQHPSNPKMSFSEW